MRVGNIRCSDSVRSGLGEVMLSAIGHGYVAALECCQDNLALRPKANREVIGKVIGKTRESEASDIAEGTRNATGQANFNLTATHGVPEYCLKVALVLRYRSIERHC